MKTTTTLQNILDQAKDEEDLNQYIDTFISKDILFCDFIANKIEEKSLSKSSVIKLTGIQRNYAYQIINGEKTPSRDKVIAFCLAMNFTLKECQQALKINHSGVLYNKIKRDAIIIFAINKSLDVIATNELLYEMGEDILK